MAHSGLVEIRAILQLIQLELEVHLRGCHRAKKNDLMLKIHDRIERANVLVQAEINKLPLGLPPIPDTEEGEDGESHDSGEGVSI